MKPFVVLLLLLALTVFFFAAQSFRSDLFETTFSPQFPLPTPTAKEPEGSGGAPRKTPPVTTGTSSNPGNFVGPNEPPHIVGPTAPPPGN